MDIDNYRRIMKQKIANNERELNELAVEFVLANNTIKKGDIITDHIGSIVVEKVQVTLTLGRDNPKAAYTGEVLTKKLKPLKRPKKRSVYEVDLKKVL